MPLVTELSGLPCRRLSRGLQLPAKLLEASIPWQEGPQAGCHRLWQVKIHRTQSQSKWQGHRALDARQIEASQQVRQGKHHSSPLQAVAPSMVRAAAELEQPRQSQW